MYLLISVKILLCETSSICCFPTWFEAYILVVNLNRVNKVRNRGFGILNASSPTGANIGSVL